MRVGDLKKGMLLECVNDNDSFMVHEGKNAWLYVRPMMKRGEFRTGFTEDKIIMYIGTKKDMNIDIPWCDKFVFVDKKIVGVDPGCWNRIRIVDESR